jgi:hypothetical protein
MLIKRSTHQILDLDWVQTFPQVMFMIFVQAEQLLVVVAVVALESMRVVGADVLHTQPATDYLVFVQMAEQVDGIDAQDTATVALLCLKTVTATHNLLVLADLGIIRYKAHQEHL